MVSHKLVAALLIILVELRVAKFDTVEIKLGSRNAIIPLNGHVKVKRFKPEEFENLKMNIPNLVELVAKAKNRLPPTAPPFPPLHHPLPPDPYQPAPEYERTYPHLSNQYHPEYQVPNYSKAHLSRNHLNQPPINRHFPEYDHQENHFEQILPRQYHPLPYYDYIQPLRHSKKAVQGGTEYYPLLRTPKHSQSRPQVTTTGNNFPTIMHMTEPHLKTKVINGVHTHQEDMPRKHLPTFRYTDRRIQHDTKNRAHTQASNKNRDYIATLEAHHELSPNISTWLHDHEILKHIPFEKPASRSKNPSAAHGPRETFGTVYRGAPIRYTGNSTILEDTEVPKDKIHITAKKNLPPHLTSRLKDDKLTAHPKYTIEKNVVTSQPTSLLEENMGVFRSTITAKGNELSAFLAETRKTGARNNAVESHGTLTSKPDVVIPRTSSISTKNLKEVYSKLQPHKTTMNLHLRDVWALEFQTPNPVDRSSQYQTSTMNSVSSTQSTNAYKKLDALTSYIRKTNHTSVKKEFKEDTTVNTQKLFRDITANDPVLIRNKETLKQNTRRNIKKFSPEHDILPVTKEQVTTLQPQIPQFETDFKIKSSLKNDTTTNSQNMHYFMEMGIPLSITPKEFPVTEPKRDISPVSSYEHEITVNTQENYTSSVLDTTDNSAKNVKDELQVENSTTVILASSFFGHKIAANSSQIYNPETLYTQDPQIDIAIKSPERDTTTKVEIFVAASTIDDDRNTSVQNNNMRIESFERDLSIATSDPLEKYIDMSTNAPALDITLESHAGNLSKNIPITAFSENSLRTDSEETSIDVTTTTSSEHDIASEALDIAALTGTDSSPLNITTESHTRESTVNFPPSFKKSEIQDSKDLFFNEYDTTTLSQIYTTTRTDELAIYTATEFYSPDSVTDVPTTDNIKTHVNPTDPTVSLTGPIKISAENTITYPQERYSETEVDKLIWMTTTESGESMEPDLGSNPKDVNHSISINTQVLSTIAERYTQDIRTDISATISPEYNTYNIPRITTDEYALTETREPHIQNSKTNTPPTSLEHDIATDVEDVLTTTESSRASIDGMTMMSSIELMTEMLPASPATPSSSLQHKTAEIDAVAAVKPHPCKHGRKKACGRRRTSGPGPAVTGRRRRRRRRRTTRAPHPPSAAPASASR